MQFYAHKPQLLHAPKGFLLVLLAGEMGTWVCNPVKAPGKPPGQLCYSIVLAAHTIQIVHGARLDKGYIDTVALLAFQKRCFSEIFIENLVKPEVSMRIHDFHCSLPE
jgi:hypothetical protein